ncbi:hypothetical protein OESDEN_00876 [Oesophagostomum dentatum]|uniref:Uncharacterized protein n=1 Tax=Oesophagostomum dentatum TaxID=61180 RepID=A0A0B1TPJ6_OESDE|nr:hypothetical protein OESDEN_00876 [Oesophagostomum dentatum]
MYLLSNQQLLQGSGQLETAAFMLFSRYRIIWHVLCGSSCLGLSVCCALFVDFISLLTLHIVCFDVYASR